MWQTFKCCRCAKFSPCHCKRKIPVHLKLPFQMPTLNIFEHEAKISKIGWIPLEVYRIFAGKGYRLNVAKFKMFFDAQSFHLAIAKEKYMCTWNCPIQTPTQNIFEQRQRFRKSVEYLWRYSDSCWHRVQVERGKISNVVRCAKFSTLPLQKLATCEPETSHPNAQPEHLRAEAMISKIGWIPLEI